VARCCGQPHQTISVGDDFLARFPVLAEKAISVSDGAMDVTGAVELYVNHIARGIAPIRLTGNYGSEILRRHVAFKALPITPAVYNHDVVHLGAQAVNTYAAEEDCHPLSFIAFKQVPWHHHARLSVEQSQLTVRSPFLDNDLVQLAYQASSPQAVGPDLYLRLIAQVNPILGRIPTDRGLRYPSRPLVTRAAHLYQEFTVRLEYAFDYGMPSWLAGINRDFLPSAAERLVLGRHKFYHFRVWYRDILGPWVKDVLLDPRAQRRGHIRFGHLEDFVLAHTTGRSNHTTELHKLLTLELIHQQLLGPR
jgi:asparagine synthase (glutamine-hydrolysing)